MIFLWFTQNPEKCYQILDSHKMMNRLHRCPDLTHTILKKMWHDIWSGSIYFAKKVSDYLLTETIKYKLQVSAGLFGLSKERPVLGNHAKVHIFGLRHENTPIKPRRSTWRVHEKRTKSAWKAYLQGIVTLCFYICNGWSKENVSDNHNL